MDVRQQLPAAQVKSPGKLYLVDGPWLHPSGHYIDAIVITDNRGNTIPVPDEVLESLKTPTVTSIAAHLQPETHAVAILLFDVFDTTVYTERPIGEKANAARDLRALGFKPCIVDLRNFYREAKNKRTEFMNKIVTGALDPVTTEL